MMIRKRFTIGVVVAVVVLSVVGGGAVTMGVLAADEADDNDSRETATEMATNSTETGTIEANDTDWYAFDVEKGEQINVDLRITTDTNNIISFDIFGPNGEETEEGAPGAARDPYTAQPMISGPGASGGDIAEQSGTYYVRVTGESVTDYDLTVETQRLDGYEPNEQPASATSIKSGETISAVMSGLDRDTYAIDLAKGETINVAATHETYGLVNTQLVGPNASDETIRNFRNEYVVTDESPEADRFNHTANRSGTYFIRVYPVEHGIGSFDENAPYELSVTSSGADGDDESSDENKDDSETDDGTTETPEDTESTDENDSTQNDSTETPSDTDETEQSDSEETVDDTGDGDDADTPTETDGQSCEESTSDDECEERGDSSNQSEC